MRTSRPRRTGQAVFWWCTAPMFDLMWSGPILHAMHDVVATAATDAKVVVDLGCGTGLVSAACVAPGVDVIGVDGSGAMLARARAGGRVTRVVLGDVTTGQIASESADAVVLTNVLHLHPRPDLVLAAATKMVKCGGVIVASWPADGLTAQRMFGVDRAHGRGLAASLAADLLRRITGVLAVMTGVSRTRHSGTAADLRQVVAASPGLRLTKEATLLGAQDVVVLCRRDPAN